MHKYNVLFNEFLQIIFILNDINAIIKYITIEHNFSLYGSQLSIDVKINARNNCNSSKLFSLFSLHIFYESTLVRIFKLCERSKKSGYNEGDALLDISFDMLVKRFAKNDIVHISKVKVVHT